jgi:hypothetical protein
LRNSNDIFFRYSLIFLSSVFLYFLSNTFISSWFADVRLFSNFCLLFLKLHISFSKTKFIENADYITDQNVVIEKEKKK